VRLALTTKASRPAFGQELGVRLSLAGLLLITPKRGKQLAPTTEGKQSGRYAAHVKNFDCIADVLQICAYVLLLCACSAQPSGRSAGF
jgi:hypothetical protein